MAGERDVLAEALQHLTAIRIAAVASETDEERVGALKLIGEIARHGSAVLAASPQPLPREALDEVLATIRLQMDGPYITLLNRDAAAILAALSPDRPTPPCPHRFQNGPGDPWQPCKLTSEHHGQHIWGSPDRPTPP